MSERPTPMCNREQFHRDNGHAREHSIVVSVEFARSLERQLAERDAQLAAMAGLAEYWKTWERETGIKRDEAVRLYLRSTKERDEARGQLAEARTALELIADSHDAPQNDEYAREALARIDANRPAHPPTVGCGEGSNHTEL